MRACDEKERDTHGDRNIQRERKQEEGTKPNLVDAKDKN